MLLSCRVLCILFMQSAWRDPCQHAGVKRPAMPRQSAWLKLACRRHTRAHIALRQLSGCGVARARVGVSGVAGLSVSALELAAGLGVAWRLCFLVRHKPVVCPFARAVGITGVGPHPAWPSGPWPVCNLVLRA